jgi:hypothetical protein
MFFNYQRDNLSVLKPHNIVVVFWRHPPPRLCVDSVIPHAMTALP